MSFATTRTLLLATALAFAATDAAATPFTGSVQLDTSLLTSPFEIAFVLTDGSGTDDGNTTVALGNFTLGGGSAGAVDTAFTTGEVSGSLDTGVSLRDSAFIAIIASTFTPGTALSFDFEVDSTPEVGGTPDLLAFVLLGTDSTPIGTTDPSGADALLTIEAGISSTPLVRTFTGDLTAAPLVVTGSVEEPATAWMLITALAALVAVRIHRGKEKQ